MQAAWPKTKNPTPGTLAAGGPTTSRAPQTTAASSGQGPTSPSKAPASAPQIPEGPGHTLGGGRGAARGAPEDPQEIRRRRLAFLDKMQAEQKAKEQGK